MPDQIRVLLVDDESAMRQAISQWLDIAGLEVDAHASATSAIDRLNADFDGILVTDLKMEGLDGMALLRHAQELDPDLPVVMITGHGDIQIAVEAMRLGAYDFVEKPFEPERLLEIVRRASEKRRLVLENRKLRQAVIPPTLSSRIVGVSRAADELRAEVTELAATDVSVVIYGETGAGKDLIARCLHDLGRRAKGNYVAVNCAAIPETMAESEFFGHDAGAFTGATKARPGRIEHAHGGTLFLDEIDSMPMTTQGKLLRVLQERQLERLGSNRSISVDFRPIAASKIDLRTAQSRFRPDLYFRLCVAELHVPPLRERRDDILLLFDYFAAAAAKAYQREIRPLTVAQSDKLMRHDWPGNIRELRNAAERHVLGLDRATLAPAGATPNQTLAQQVDEFEKATIEQSLIEAGGRINVVMEKLGVPRRTLADKMARFGLDRRRYAEADEQKSAPDFEGLGGKPPTR
ncbi:sigma-54-dependent Fis family transcriptional regulator [Bradyrhizobium sp. 157]|uniref:sigma-54-dependent transcriptional regulator n=1 Tax=Bradyrhizobium sp. 157 TaxID=2782631 RepID=UPI001FF733AC|nr:sigma-54 dependent transcriptional regulator [Bradyrhizobium sp. 157]MCK1641630.1 sigma-54-dependent Fis family transcriptional regulator [Bradyrhizobium sp. 157]